jgi:hypothetical protein
VIPLVWWIQKAARLDTKHTHHPYLLAPFPILFQFMAVPLGIDAILIKTRNQLLVS